MSKRMLQITLTEPGKLVFGEADVPTPAQGQVLLRIERIGVCGSDPTIYRGLHPYAKSPLVMGHEFAGTIEALGPGVTAPAKGTRVTVIPHVICDNCRACKQGVYNFCEDLKCMGAEADGAYCYFVCVDARMALPIPDSMTMDDAATVEPACVAYHGAKRGEIQPTDTALVVGAGPIGLFCMQSCKVLGAKKVIVADLDPWRLDLAQKLGAEGVINVSKETLQDGLTRLCGGPKEVDVFYDCVGEKGKVLDLILQIARRGTRIVVIGVLQNGYILPHLPDFVQHELRLSGTTRYVPQDYKDMIRYMGEGKISTKGMLTHYFDLKDVQKVYDLIDARKEPFFKIMLKVPADA